LRPQLKPVGDDPSIGKNMKILIVGSKGRGDPVAKEVEMRAAKAPAASVKKAYEEALERAQRGGCQYRSRLRDAKSPAEREAMFG
jgi:hypothetical protein